MSLANFDYLFLPSPKPREAIIAQSMLTVGDWCGIASGLCLLPVAGCWRSVGYLFGEPPRTNPRGFTICMFDMSLCVGKELSGASSNHLDVPFGIDHFGDGIHPR